MHNRVPSSVILAGRTASLDTQGPAFALSEAIAFLRRRWPLMFAALVVSLILSAAYLLVQQPRYLSKATLLLDTRKLQLFMQPSIVSEVSFDAPAVDSQVELLKSDAIAGAVVDQLKLKDDPEFTGAAPGFFGPLWTATLNLVDRGSRDVSLVAPTRSQEELTRAAIAHVQSNLQIERLRMTYIIQIGFNSADANKSARIANSVAEAYISDQVQTKQFATQRTIAWLQSRVIELRDQAVTADRAVQDFRTKHSMVKVGDISLEDRALTDLNEQLTRSREETSAAKVKFDRVQLIISSGVPDASLTAWLQNDVINRLHQQYVDALRREAEYALRLGPEHEAVRNLRKDKSQIERSAAGELRRVAVGLKTDYESALARQRLLEGELAVRTKQNEGTRQEYGELQVLESNAKAYQTLHDVFLQRYVEATQQQQNVTPTEARVISPAGAGWQVYPNPRQIFTVGSLFGIIIGCAAAYGRERLNQSFRTPKQIEQVLGTECLGILPVVKVKSQRTRIEKTPQALTDCVINQNLGIARQVVLTPFSRFTETVRSIKVAADTGSIGRQAKVIGLVSAVPGEGKSTIAANLAQLIAHAGGRTLLIDSDLRNPFLTRLMAPSATRGFLELITGGQVEDLAKFVWRDPITRLEFLPGAIGNPVAHTSDLLRSPKMADLINLASQHYDYVIMDFPPLAAVVDARASSHLVDAFVLVVEWGKTNLEVVTEALSSAERIQTKLIGAVMNRANPAALRRQEKYKGSTYSQYYSSS